MKTRLRKTLIMIVILLSVFSVALLSKSVRQFCFSLEYQTFVSPDTDYSIKVYGYKTFFAVLPGGSGDRPGYVRLFNRNNEMLKEADVEMVQLVNHVEWSEHQVHIKFVADWELPE